MKVLKLLALPLVLAVVWAMRRTRRTVRFGEIWSPRLGHLIGNTECYLCEYDDGLHGDALDIWFSSRGKSSHSLIERKYKKRLHTCPGWFGRMVIEVNRLSVGGERHEAASEQFDRDIHNLWEKRGPHIGFTAAEEKRGQKLLRSLGIPEGAKWVCLIVRDAAYLKTAAPGHDFSYHDHRDSDIDNYTHAAVELMRKGYYVIRMGKIADKPIPVKHTWIIDYPFHKHQSDFGQLYLGAKCEFCFGASTGFMAIPQVFGRPTVVVNFVPLEYISTWCKGLVIWKHHIKDGKRMTLTEIINSGAGQFMYASQFQNAGITLEENSPQEITDAVLEMAEWVEGGLKPRLQRGFWDLFPLKSVSNYNAKRLHGEPRVRVGKKFLKEYL